MVANTAALVIRPILPADESGLQQFIRNLSLASRYMRFMVAMRELSGEMLDRFVHPQAGREAALVASSPIGSDNALVNGAAIATLSLAAVVLAAFVGKEMKGEGVPF